MRNLSTSDQICALLAFMFVAVASFWIYWLGTPNHPAWWVRYETRRKSRNRR